MSVSKSERVVQVGRRAGDGHLRLSVFTKDLLALTIEARGERAPTLLLTLNQISELKQTLAELEAEIGVTEANADVESDAPEAIGERESRGWDGTERRDHRQRSEP